MIKLRSLFPLLLTLAALPAPAAETIDLSRLTPVPADQPIPVVDFFRPPAMQDPKVNPSGTHIAALVTGDSDKVLLVVNDLKTQKTEVTGGPADINVTSLNWLTDHRLIYSLGAPARGSLGLLAVDVEKIKRSYPILQYYDEVVLNIPKDDRTHPVVWASYDRLETYKQMGVVVLDTDNQSGEFVDLTSSNTGTLGNPKAKENNTLHIKKSYPQLDKGWTTRHLTDQNGILDFGVSASKGVNTLYHLTGNSWTECPVDLDLIDVVDAGSKSGELAVVGPRNTGKPRPLQFMDGATGKLGEVLIEDKEYDFNGHLYRDPGSRTIVGAIYNHAGPKTVWFHETYSKFQELLNAFFPGVIARLIGNNEKGDLLLVSTFSDRQPPSYQWVDIATKKAGLIRNSAPWIDPKRMQPMSMIKFKTRDGHRLDAYVTMPAGASKQNPPPLVVLPHDGPIARDTWGFNGEVQFLASRGYAVLQPNYRGSPGTSWMFPESDDWDYVKMSNDVTDATKVLVKSGLVDGKRVAILGTSFGGYLALQGATSEPELYRCAAAITGIFDWERLVNDAKFNRYTNPEYDRWIHKLGDPDKEKAKYEAMSPLRRINRLHIPVFTAVGREDSQSTIAQTKELISQLERNNIPHESLTLGGVGRGMFYVKNRVEVYTQLEAFLAKHMR
jgi:dipeptidyl aminopeptidase/acylaminoacyl peptidase